MSDFVAVDKLTKKYGEVIAVDNLSFSVKEGEIFGFLGPNGAGKSTTLNVLSTLLSYEKGEITVGGYKLSGDARSIKALIGLVPQNIALHSGLTAMENVSFFAALYGLSGRALKSAAADALSFVGLSEHQKTRCSRLSGGMQRRLNIACGIAHNPKLIVMDEPTVGVDAQSRGHIISSIRTLRERGATVIYTSHYMPEVQEICDRIAIIDKGRLAACGTEDELLTLVTDTKSIYIDIAMPESADIKRLLDRLGAIPDTRGVQYQEDISRIKLDVSLTFPGISPIFQIISDENIQIQKLSTEAPNLETTFLALTGHDLR